MIGSRVLFQGDFYLLVDHEILKDLEVLGIQHLLSAQAPQVHL